MRYLAPPLLLLVLYLGNSATADSDFFNSSSVPSELFAGQKPKVDPAAPAGAPIPVAPSVANPKDAKAEVQIKKVDMPREVFMDWIDGDDVHAAQEQEASNDRAPSGKRTAPDTKNIDELLERELKKPGFKKDSTDEDERRFIEVN